MDLINDLETELAFAFLVEKRFRQRIDSDAAVALIGRVKTLLQSAAERRAAQPRADEANVRTASEH